MIICCYNSEQRIQSTLRYLLKQYVSSNRPWEVALVDNCCTDDTEVVALRTWGNSTIPLKVAKENRAGLANARLRGIQASK